MKRLFHAVLFMVAAVAAGAQSCTELFISEYVEGSSNNKAIEIYNPTGVAVNLSGYKLQLYANGSATATSVLSLAGTVAAGDVYVVVNSQANAAIKAARDTTSGVTNFNGDDAVALLNGTTVIDVIGEIGTDPGTEWAVDSGSTANHTLRRKVAVQEGTASWTTGTTQWDVFPQDSIQLGSHSMTSCAAPTDTIVRFMPVSASVNETAGSYDVTLVLNQPAATDKTVDIALKSGTPADIGNFATANLTISAGATSVPVTVTITNDTLAEGSEQFTFVLRNASGGLLIGNDSVFTLTVQDDDSIAPPAPLYSIATVTTLDSVGVSDSTGVKCRVSGVIYGVNLRNSGLQFTIHDGTGGMGVFSSTNNFGYTVEEGDSVVVSGEVGEFAGYTQMEALDTLYEAGTGTLLQPLVTTVLDESTESELVRINHVWLVNAVQWNNSNPSGFTADITDGTSTFALRVEEQVDLFNQPAPTSSFDIIGLGSQFDNSAPYTSGYQILPRYSADLILHTGIEEEQNQKFAGVYPNPSSGIFTIVNKNQAEGITKITVTDITGKLVLETASGLHAENRIDLSGAAPGLYFASVFFRTSRSGIKLNVLSGR